MRIKVVGQVTEEKLLNAFRVAQNQISQHIEGAQFFGVNLYFSIYDEHGAHIEDQIELLIQPQPGELVRPALRGEALELRRERAAAKKKAREEQIAEDARWEQEMHERAQRRLQLRKRSESVFNDLNTVTESMLSHCSEEFLKLLNEVVRRTWGEFKPIESTGKNKGAPSPMPVYLVKEGMLLVSKPGLKSPRQLRNPIYLKPDYYGNMVLIWKNEAWLEVTKRICALMEPMKKKFSMPDEVSA